MSALPPRVYVDDPSVGTIVLGAGRSHHLVRVLRFRNGDQLELFDGEGRVWVAQVRDADANACEVEVGSSVTSYTPAAPKLALAQAVLKQNAMGRALRHATELGVSAIWPLATARTQSSGRRVAPRYKHWQRIVVSACEQSRRANLPPVHSLQPFIEFVEQINVATALLLHPEAEPLPREMPLEDTTVLVGPEGGWTRDELIWAANRGIRVFGMGALILRAETASLAALAAIRHSWRWGQLA